MHKDLSKAKTSFKSGLCVEYLAHYHGQIERGRIQPAHKHESWQMELIASGSVELLTSSGSQNVECGSYIIIPPALEHGFHYGEDAGIATIFFSMEPPSAGFMEAPLVGSGRAAAAIVSSLAAIAASDTLSKGERLFLECVLNAAAELCAMDAEAGKSSKPSSPYVRKAEECIACRAGSRLTVKELAEEAGCAAPYLSSLFKQETGMSLKKRLDSARMDAIRRQLLYSDLSIVEISRRTGFPDIFSFSRFVRSQTGKCPRAFRKGQCG